MHAAHLGTGKQFDAYRIVVGVLRIPNDELVVDCNFVGTGVGLGASAHNLRGGRFRWPEGGATAAKMVLSQEELALLVGGIDLNETRPRRWYRKPLGEEPAKLRIPA